eukprot:g16733.t1
MSGSGSDDKRPSRVLDHLFIGSRVHAKNRGLLKDLGINRILNVTPARTMDPTNGVPNFFEKDRSMTYKRVAVFDNRGEDLLQHLESCISFIEQGSFYGKVLVHCNKGVSRSSTVVAAYLMRTRGLSKTAAMTYLRSRRSIVNPHEGFMAQLEAFDVKLNGEREAAIADGQEKKFPNDLLGRKAAQGPTIGPIGPPRGPAAPTPSPQNPSQSTSPMRRPASGASPPRATGAEVGSRQRPAAGVRELQGGVSGGSASQALLPGSAGESAGAERLSAATSAANGSASEMPPSAGAAEVGAPIGPTMEPPWKVDAPVLKGDPPAGGADIDGDQGASVAESVGEGTGDRSGGGSGGKRAREGGSASNATEKVAQKPRTTVSGDEEA